MSEWFAASTLAGLPDIPSTDRRVRAKAEREGWQRRKKAKGKGFEYHVSSLPEKARQALAAESTRVESQAAQAGRADAARLKQADKQQQADIRTAQGNGLAQLGRLTGVRRDRAEARLAIIDALDAYTQQSDMARTPAMHAFEAYYNDGVIDVADWIRQQVATVSISTIYRWIAAEKSDGAARLAGNYGNRRGTGKIDSQPEMYEYAEAMIATYPTLGGKQLLRSLKAKFAGRDDIKIPSQSACEKWLRAWKKTHKSLHLSIANPDAWNSRYRPAFGKADEDVVRINQRWELDSTPADMMCTDGRFHLVAVIDIYTRRVRLVVAKSSTSKSVSQVFRRAVLDWGVPESVVTDNGSDYVSHHIKRVWRFFDIESIVCDPYSGWQKPFIERVFGTFMRDLVEMAPGYCGHSVADRQAIESQATFAKRLQDPDEVFNIRMSSDELQIMCDRWVENLYEREVHGSLGCTPAEKAAGQAVRRVDDERVLDVLLSQAPSGGVRTVRKKGVSVDGYDYIHAELGREDIMGQPVQVLLDEHDIGRIYVFADLGHDWQFICVAECPEITGISRQEVAAEVRARNDRAVRDARNAMNKAKRRHKTSDVVEDILTHAERNADRVTHLPGRADDAEAPGINAARDALSAVDAEPDTPDTLDDSTRQRLREQLQTEQAEAAERSPREQFRAWQAMVARTAPSDAERRGWQMYESSAAFRVRYEAAYGDEFHGHAPGEPHEADATERTHDDTPRQEAK